MLRRKVKRPKLRPANRTLIAAAARHLPAAARSSLLVTPRTPLRLAPGACATEVAASGGDTRAAAALSGDPGARAQAYPRESALGLSPDQKRACQA